MVCEFRGDFSETLTERALKAIADASREKIFSNKLTIVIRPEDAENFQINLFEVRDYLTSLHA